MKVQTTLNHASALGLSPALQGRGLQPQEPPDPPGLGRGHNKSGALTDQGPPYETKGETVSVFLWKHRARQTRSRLLDQDPGNGLPHNMGHQQGQTHNRPLLVITHM